MEPEKVTEVANPAAFEVVVTPIECVQKRGETHG